LSSISSQFESISLSKAENKHQELSLKSLKASSSVIKLKEHNCSTVLTERGEKDEDEEEEFNYES
jgi:hypothetical protein